MDKIKIKIISKGCYYDDEIISFLKQRPDANLCDYDEKKSRMTCKITAEIIFPEGYCDIIGKIAQKYNVEYKYMYSINAYVIYVTAQAKSKRSKDDTYNFEKGRFIAETKAFALLNEKMARILKDVATEMMQRTLNCTETLKACVNTAKKYTEMLENA